MRNIPEVVNRFLTFLNESPTPFHAVFKASTKLEKAGFVKLREKDEWDVKPGGKYYFTRNQAALIAFTLPTNWKQGAGVSIVGTHVDSPNLRLRPASKKTKSGYLQLAVETYGGGIWHSWLDRDLSLAGRIVVGSSSGSFESKLIKIDRPLMQIPTLAMDRNVNENFKFNQETEFMPVVGLLEDRSNGKEKRDDKDAPSKPSTIQNNHSPEILSLLAEELSVSVDQIHDFEISLYDTQPSVLGGINNEFIFSPRLDNLFSSFCAVEALAESEVGEGNVNAIALFNHEEIGSVSTSGAESTLIPFLISRLSPTTELHAQSISKSFLVSSDVSHALHPNYTDKHQANHRPLINSGVVIKTNAKQRYATDAISSFIARQLVMKKNGLVQEFEVRNDMACGSTIGPHLSVTGIRTVDVGVGILSMHSIRETGGTKDIQYLIDLFSSLFEGFADLDQTLAVD